MYHKDSELAMMLAYKIATDKRHEFILPEHLLLAISDNEDIMKIIHNCGGNIKELQIHLAEFLDNEYESLSEDLFVGSQESIAIQRVLKGAWVQIMNAENNLVKPIDLLVSMFNEEDSNAVYFLQKQGIDRLKVIREISHGEIEHNTNKKIDDFEGEDDDFEIATRNANGESFLQQFGTNLTEMAFDGEIDDVIGRSSEIDQMVETLVRRKKNNPILVGEAGVGKTSVVEGLALRIARDEVPEQLKLAQIFSVDMGSIVAGTKFRGDFEKRIKGIIDEATNIEGAIVFIDEFHMIVGAGSTSEGSMDASNLLKPSLSSGAIKCIGATTYKEFKNNIEKDSALTRRLQKIDIKEPSIDDCVEILEGIKHHYEDHHGVKYSKRVVQGIVELSDKYMHDKHLPDKAIDVMDVVGAKIAVMPKDVRHKRVSQKDVEGSISKMTNIPLASVSVSEKQKVKSLDEEIGSVVFGQPDAVKQVTRSIKMAKSGLGDETKPLGSFLFAGPTGCGKTELAKQLSNKLGVEFIRFDMSEYAEKHAVAKLIGAPPGYVGFDQEGQLTGAVSKNPHCVILLDEIEKAHPEIFNIMLQIFDYGFLTDNNGKKANFRNTVIIMTSNVGVKDAQHAKGKVGFGGATADTQGAVMKAIEKKFSPEFRNRLDSIIQFNSLTKDLMENIVDKFMQPIVDKLTKKKLKFKMTKQAKSWLAEKGFDPKMGARPLQRLINKEVKEPMIDFLLDDEMEKGGKVLVDIVDNKINVVVTPN